MGKLIEAAWAQIAPIHAAKRAAARHALQAMNSGYSHGAASTTKTSMKGWDSTSLSPQSDVDRNLRLLRERSRDLYATSPVATSAVNRNLVHIVGPGLRASPHIDAEALGMTEDDAASAERRIRTAFNAWASGKGCDVTGQNTFYELQQIALMTWLLSGEVFALHDFDGRGGGLRVRLVEGDLCCNPGASTLSTNVWAKNKDTGNRIYNGIEIGRDGSVVAYHFVSCYRDQVGEPTEWVRVPALGALTGTPNVLHVFKADRPTQYRGVPYLAPVIESIKQLTRYTDAEIMAAVINGMFSVFITTDNGTSPILGESEDEDGLDEGELALGNGNIATLAPGEGVQVVDAKRPNSNFGGFTDAMAKYIGSALNIPAELLFMQFNASYSASRGALMEAWEFFSLNRTWFSADFCQPIYEMWLADAVAKGVIDAPGFFSDDLVRAAWSACDWTGPAPGQLNPTVEVNAAKARIDAGLSTGEREALALNGTSYEENLRQLAQEKQLRVNLGLEESEDGNATD